MSNDSLPASHILLAVKHHPEMVKKPVQFESTMIDAFRKALQDRRGKHSS